MKIFDYTMVVYNGVMGFYFTVDEIPGNAYEIAYSFIRMTHNKDFDLNKIKMFFEVKNEKNL